MEEPKQQSSDCPVPNGALLLVGGAEKKENSGASGSANYMEIIEAFMRLLKSKNPVIEVITTAGSEDPKGSFRMYKKAFMDIADSTVRHMHHDKREAVNFEQSRDRLEEADGIFIAGGDQLKLTSVYGGTELFRFVKERYIYHKLVIAGTSAGAMALSTPMIYFGIGRDEMVAGNVKITTGLEFIKDVCVDTHFVQRGRFVRMAQVIATNPGCIGVGIEEDTALLILNGTEAEVLGSGVVTVIDGRNSYGSNITDFNNEQLITIRGLQVHVLSRGQKYEIPQVNPPHI